MTIISLTHNSSIKLILILSLFITSFTMTFASVLEGNVWMDNGCLGGPIGCPIEGAHISATSLTNEQDDIVTESFKYEDGHLIVSDKPGLGVEIDDKKIEKYRTG